MTHPIENTAAPLPLPSINEVFPDEILLKIFQSAIPDFASFEEENTLRRAAQTCRKWNRIIECNILPAVYKERMGGAKTLISMMLETLSLSTASSLRRNLVNISLLTDDRVKWERLQRMIQIFYKELYQFKADIEIPPICRETVIQAIREAGSTKRGASVQMADTRVSRSTLHCLFKGLEGTKIQKLHFIKVDFGKDSSPAIKSLIESTTLKGLTFSHCKGGADFATACLQGLLNNRSLSYFYLNDHPLQFDTLLSESSNDTLEKLSLVDCSIQDEHCQSMGRMIASYGALMDLNLVNNQITIGGVINLATVIDKEANGELNSLNVNYNRIRTIPPEVRQQLRTRFPNLCHISYH